MWHVSEVKESVVYFAQCLMLTFAISVFFVFLGSYPLFSFSIFGIGEKELQLWETSLQLLQLNTKLMGIFLGIIWYYTLLKVLLNNITVPLFAYLLNYFGFDRSEYAFNPKDVKLKKKTASPATASKLTESEIKERIIRLSQIFANKVWFYVNYNFVLEILLGCTLLGVYCLLNIIFKSGSVLLCSYPWLS